MLMHATVPWPVNETAAWIEASAYNGQLGYRLGIFKKDGPLIEYIGWALGQSAAREKKEEVREYSLSRTALRAL